MTENRIKHHLILSVVLIIAAVLRFWGIDYCLPNIECSLEEKLITNIAFQFGSGDLNPHFFYYPTLYMYSLFFTFASYFLAGMTIGEFASMTDFITEYSVNPSNFFLINRGFSALLGTATVFVVYKMAKQLFKKQTAIIASLFLAVSYSHVRQSHLGVTDIPMVFLVYVSLLFTIKSYKEKTLTNYILSGTFAGLALSTKYFSFPLPIAIVAVHLLNIFNMNGNKIRLFFDKRLFLFFAAFIMAFLMGTPFALLDFSEFSSYVWHTKELMVTPWGIDLGKGWLYHIRYSLFYGLGWPLFIVSFLGLITLIKTDRKKFILLSSFPLAYYLLIGSISWVFVRYTLPLIPFLCITGAVFIVRVIEKSEGYLNYRFKILLTILLPVLIIMPSAYTSIRSNELLTKKDSRLLAAEWIQNSIPENSSVYQTGLMWGKIQIYPPLQSLENTYANIISRGEKGRMLKGKIDYFRNQNISGQEEWTYDVGLRKFKYDQVEQDTLPDYIIVQESPLKAWSRTPYEIKELIKSSYKLIQALKTTDVMNKENWFDLQDALYYPFAGFEKIQRPGPNFYIYRRN